MTLKNEPPPYETYIFLSRNCRNIGIFESYELLFKYLFELYSQQNCERSSKMTKIFHGCLDGIRTAPPSSGKIMVIVKNMLGQEALYLTHSYVKIGH